MAKGMKKKPVKLNLGKPTGPISVYDKTILRAAGIKS